MEKHLSHDFNTPIPTTTNPLKEGQEIGLCSKPKKRMDGWGEEGREVGLMTGQSGGRSRRTGAVMWHSSSSTESVPLKRGSTTWAATLIGPDKKGLPFIFFLEMTESCNGMESVSECDQWQWPIWTASRAMWDSNTPRQGLQVRVGEPADWE